jgi:hypothetical protein
MKPAQKRRLSFLGGFALYFGSLWFLWETPFVYPLKIFVVLLHETSHAIALVATGGHLDRIVLDPLEGGATYPVIDRNGNMAGSAFWTLSAGYLGSLVWGAAMVLAARAKRLRADLAIGFLGAVVIALTLFYVRSTFGFVFGLVFGTALAVSGRHFSDLWNRRALLTLGLTSCLYAVLDIKSDVLDRPELESDAHMLATLTGVPTLFWGSLWIAVALGVSFLLFRKVYRDA